MKRLLAFLLLFTIQLYAQEDAWVYFTDKPDAEYYLENPLEMLSQKALDRRAAQNVALDDKDVPISPVYIDGVTGAEGITVMAKSKWLNALHVRGGKDDISALLSLPFVASVEFANAGFTGKPVVKKEIKDTPKQLAVQAEFNYGNAAAQIQMLNGHLLHKDGFSGAGKTIAVLDAGFPGTDTSPVMQHMYNNNLMLGGYNFVERSDDVYTGGSHGTLVLSTMAGYVDGQLVGTAPNAFYYLFVTEDMTGENPVEESYWVEAAEAADSLGVDVINTSLGYFTYDNPAYSHVYSDVNGQTAFITRGANVAFTRGIFLVTSAGNSAATVNPHIGVPADAFNTLTVGAVNSLEQYASFSSIGPSFDGRIKPDVVAMGQASAYASVGGTVTAGNGTSFSSPITAGLVACLWQALPKLTNIELLNIIRQSADRYAAPDDFYGYGIPDFWAAYQNETLATDERKLDAIKIYPNPANNKINVVVPDFSPGAEIVVYNNLGQCVLQTSLYHSNSIIDVSGLAADIYFYKVFLNGTAHTGELIKN